MPSTEALHSPTQQIAQTSAYDFEHRKAEGRTENTGGVEAGVRARSESERDCTEKEVENPFSLDQNPTAIAMNDFLKVCFAVMVVIAVRQMPHSAFLDFIATFLFEVLPGILLLACVVYAFVFKQK